MTGSRVGVEGLDRSGGPGVEPVFGAGVGLRVGPEVIPGSRVDPGVWVC